MTAERVFDRTPGTGPTAGMANQLGTVFARHDCTPRWRERLPELALPVLAVHGRRDPFFPVGNGEALARGCSSSKRPRPRSPGRAADEVAAATLAL